MEKSGNIDDNKADDIKSEVVVASKASIDSKVVDGGGVGGKIKKGEIVEKGEVMNGKLEKGGDGKGENVDCVLIQLKSSDISQYRDMIMKKQDYRCAICECDIKDKKGVSLDHQHKTKKEKIGVGGAGLVRGVLCRDCNVFEGKIWNNSKRYGKFDNLPTFLRAVADYLERDNFPYIHPKEAHIVKKVSKRQYNKLVKAYASQTKLKADLPVFPGKRKPSKRLLLLFEKFDIDPYL